jgi:hypothetical protein
VGRMASVATERLDALVGSRDLDVSAVPGRLICSSGASCLLTLKVSGQA